MIMEWKKTRGGGGRLPRNFAAGAFTICPENNSLGRIINGMILVLW